jgi:hypothetical protein
MISFDDALQTVSKNIRGRDYPGRGNSRCTGKELFPQFNPKFNIDFSSGTSAFTIGSCFARNMEEALEPLGVSLPTKAFAVPKEEWRNRPNGLLNEYNPGTITQRILDALGGDRGPEDTIVKSGFGYADLMLPGGTDVSLERAIERRQEIFDVYANLETCGAVIVTLGLVEAWYDNQAQRYLNRMPPVGYAKSHPDRFEFRRLDVFDAMPMLEAAVRALAEKNIKVVLTVSPVPLQKTFTSDDCVVANEFSKSVLRVCADRLSKSHHNVDYFPSYEIVRSAGLAGYMDDNVHVRGELVERITSYMVQRYCEKQL